MSDHLRSLGLERLWRLRQETARFENAYWDAWQHTVNNEDWEADWIVSDSRTNLLNVGDDLFLRFLAAFVNFDAAEPEAQAAKVERLNSVLIPRGLTFTKDQSLGEFSEYRVVSANSAPISNQGRAHSSNVASISADGLLFRSQPEVALYRELKRSGYVFAPLPVFLCPRRIEPDFVILHEGMIFAVEVDGTYTHRESPAEAQERVRTMEHHGAYVIRIVADGPPDAEWSKASMSKIVESVEARKRLK